MYCTCREGGETKTKTTQGQKLLVSCILYLVSCTVEKGQGWLAFVQCAIGESCRHLSHGSKQPSPTNLSFVVVLGEKRGRKQRDQITPLATVRFFFWLWNIPKVDMQRWDKSNVWNGWAGTDKERGKKKSGWTKKEWEWVILQPGENWVTHSLYYSHCKRQSRRR